MDMGNYEMPNGKSYSNHTLKQNSKTCAQRKTETMYMALIFGMVGRPALAVYGRDIRDAWASGGRGIWPGYPG